MCDVIVGNDVEFGFMAGDYDKGLDKARALVAEGAQIAVYKMGEAGAITITPEGEVTHRHLPHGGAETHGRGRQFHGRLRQRPRGGAKRAGRRAARLRRRRDGRGAWAARLPCQAVQNSTIFSKRMTGQARPERT
jgi:hypothetical protein